MEFSLAHLGKQWFSPSCSSSPPSTVRIFEAFFHYVFHGCGSLDDNLERFIFEDMRVLEYE
jgi:hypothetical protein